MRACRSTVSDWSTANYLNGKLPCGCLERLSSLEHCADVPEVPRPNETAIDKRLCKCLFACRLLRRALRVGGLAAASLGVFWKALDAEIARQDSEWLERRR